MEAPRYRFSPEILVVEPLIDIQVQSLDFSHGAELAEIGYRTSRRILSIWLDELEGASSLYAKGA